METSKPSFRWKKSNKDQDLDSTNVKKNKGVNKTLSKESMFFIVTFNSVTGAPVHSKANAKNGKNVTKNVNHQNLQWDH